MKEYLDNFEEYLKEAYKIVYVIDIQYKERYDLALDYFKRIIERIERFRSNIEITIFLHKYDPDLEDLRPDINEKSIEQLISRIKQLIPDGIYFEIFTSTIYTVFDKTLMK